jgi:hypothetical protein
LGIGHQKEEQATISKAGTEAEAFVVGEVATGEIDARAELGEQLLLKDVAGLMTSGVNEIELDVDEGADRLGSLADFTFQHYNASIVEGSQSADAISVLALGALDCRRIGVIPILMEGL